MGKEIEKTLKKAVFEAPSMEIILFSSNDIITASIPFIPSIEERDNDPGQGEWDIVGEIAEIAGGGESE